MSTFTVSFSAVGTGLKITSGGIAGPGGQGVGTTLQAAMSNVLDQALLRIGNHIAERAKATAPILTGALRASLTPSPVTGSGNQKSISIVSDIPYAVDMHEYQVKTITNQPIYGLGPFSRIADAQFLQGRNILGQYSQAEGGVGGSFITRVVNAHAPSYKEFIRRALERNLAQAFFKPGSTGNFQVI